MVSELRFDGRVAVVTGAGGNPSLGRAHAIMLASRGARVVVNDIGRDPQDRHYKDEASAEAVAEEIRAAGGEAVADTNSVATEASARAVIDTAHNTFGRIDILVNNAGICPLGLLHEYESLEIERTVAVNLMGTMWMCRAAWPHMLEAGYGRIVNVSSGALTGFPEISVYGATKGAVFSFTRALAMEGASRGIRVNSVSPAAYTRMIIAMQAPGSKLLELTKRTQPAELVSPVVALLTHEDCPCNGENLNVAGGHVSRTYICETRGITDVKLTPESVDAAFGDIVDESDSVLWQPGSVGAVSELSAEDLVDNATS